MIDDISKTVGSVSDKITRERAKNPYWSAAVKVAGLFGRKEERPIIRALSKGIRLLDIFNELRHDIYESEHIIDGGLREYAINKGLCPMVSDFNVNRLLSKYLSHVKNTSIEKDFGVCKLLKVNVDDDSEFYITSGNTDQGVLEEIYFKGDEFERLMISISNIIWRNDNQLELIFNNEYGHDSGPNLISLPAPGDYVDGEGDVKSTLDIVADRTNAFFNANISRKILLYGPPGTGKTTLARKLACRLGGRLLKINGDDLNNIGYIILILMRMIRPNVILIDDMDRCGHMMAGMLSAISSLNSSGHNIAVVATANVIESLDPAILRPGRFDEIHEVPEPTEEYRLSVLKHYVEKFNFKADLEKLNDEIAGFSPADIQELIMTVSTVGGSFLDDEIKRIKFQRELYSGDACRSFSENKGFIRTFGGGLSKRMY
jgi:hypothetical protein